MTNFFGLTKWVRPEFAGAIFFSSLLERTLTSATGSFEQTLVTWPAIVKFNVGGAGFWRVDGRDPEVKARVKI